MVKIKKENLNQIINKVPEGVGLFICYNGDKPLFFKITENLQRFINYYLLDETQDEILLELRESFDSIELIPSKDLFTCLLEEKLFFSKNKPYFNSQIIENKYYSYLSVRWDEVPYLQSSNDTLKDSIYIGPFRDIFFIQDIIDTFANVYKLPSCEGEQYPCEKMQAQICAGFCMLTDDNDLKSILINYLVSPNLAVLKDLRTKAADAEEDLDFITSDLLQTQYKLISNYYRQLFFLYITRHLEFDGEHNGTKLSIKKGMINSIILKDGTKHEFFNKDYPRPNELLAVNKNELDERWIVFRMLEEEKSDYVKDLFHKQFQQILNKILKNYNNSKKEEA